MEVRRQIRQPNGAWQKGKGGAKSDPQPPRSTFCFADDRLRTLRNHCSWAGRQQANPQNGDSNNTVTAAKALSSSVPAARKVTVREPIPYPTLRKATSQLRNGTSRTIQNGTTGEKVIVYRVYSRMDGVELRREKINSRTTKQPVPAIVEVGIQSALPSRGGYYGGSHRSLAMKASYYLPFNLRRVRNRANGDRLESRLRRRRSRSQLYSIGNPTLY